MNKRYLLILFTSIATMLLIYSFQSQRTGVRVTSGPYKDMVYIPGGTFIMGQSDQDVMSSQISQSRQVTISPFYMDATEVTNERYREFVEWVRDSILITQFLNSSDYYIQTEAGEEFIDWDKVARWRRSRGDSPWRSSDPVVRGQVEQMFYQGADRIHGKDEYDVRIFNYRREWYDLRSAIMARNDTSVVRSDFIRRELTNIYPDTTVWVADFTYAQNEPMVEAYFSHPSYNEYPVVGVSWKQAEAFNHWRTKMIEDEQAKRNESNRQQVLAFTLPSEAEWEYAARGGKVGLPYPWGGPSARPGGQLMANFKPGRGDYLGGDHNSGGDGFEYTAPVANYPQNDVGLYDMAGNVAEWTSSTFHESASAFVHDLNPTYTHEATEEEAEAMKRKVVRGGSWKDVAFFLQNGARTYEYQDSSKSYIGFRSISRAPGGQ